MRMCEAMFKSTVAQIVRRRTAGTASRRPAISWVVQGLAGDQTVTTLPPVQAFVQAQTGGQSIIVRP